MRAAPCLVRAAAGVVVWAACDGDQGGPSRDAHGGDPAGDASRGVAADGAGGGAAAPDGGADGAAPAACEPGAEPFAVEATADFDPWVLLREENDGDVAAYGIAGRVSEVVSDGFVLDTDGGPVRVRATVEGAAVARPAEGSEVSLRRCWIEGGDGPGVGDLVITWDGSTRLRAREGEPYLEPWAQVPECDLSLSFDLSPADPGCAWVGDDPEDCRWRPAALRLEPAGAAVPPGEVARVDAPDGSHWLAAVGDLREWDSGCGDGKGFDGRWLIARAAADE